MTEKRSTIVEKFNIVTFVVTERSRSQTALYNQKRSGFNFNCVTGYHHISISTVSPAAITFQFQLCHRLPSHPVLAFCQPLTVKNQS